MRRLVTLVISLGVVVGALMHAPAVDSPVAPLGVDSPLHRVAVVGDSYTNGTDLGGRGPNAWPVRAWRTLKGQGIQIAPDVAAEGRAGYGVRGDQGNLFIDLTGRAVNPDDELVVFFGSRNDQGVDPFALSGMAQDAFGLARRVAPAAKLLVIGPPWPTADVPGAVLQIRDVLSLQARLAGATFIDPIAERWFVDRPTLIGPDGVHPNDSGHVYLAQMIAPLIGAQLQRN